MNNKSFLLLFSLCYLTITEIAKGTRLAKAKLCTMHRSNCSCCLPISLLIVLCIYSGVEESFSTRALATELTDVSSS